jgi:hypothetical protein
MSTVEQSKIKCQLDEKRKKEENEKRKKENENIKKEEKKLITTREPYDKERITFFFP